MTTLVSRADLERFAHACQTAHASGALPADQLKALHARLMARGTDGATWTVGLTTLKWHVARDGKWQPGEPPVQLTVEDDLLARLRDVEAMLRPAGARTAGEPPTAGRPPTTMLASMPVSDKGQVHCLTGHRDKVLKVAFSRDGRHGLSAAANGEIQIWDLESGKSVDRILAGSSLTAAAFSPDGQQFLCHDGDLRLWDIRGRRQVSRFESGGFVEAIAFAPDGRTALFGHVDKSLRVLDIVAGRETRRLVGHKGSVEAVAWAPDGRHAVSTRPDIEEEGDGVLMWDLAGSGEPRRPERAIPMPSCCAVSPDSARCLAGSLTTDIYQWETASGREIGVHAGHSGNVLAVAFAPDGRWLSASGTDFYDAKLLGELGRDNTVRLWNADGTREIARFEGHAGNVNSVAVSADGRFALSGSSDRTVRMWSLPA